MRPKGGALKVYMAPGMLKEFPPNSCSVLLVKKKFTDKTKEGEGIYYGLLTSKSNSGLEKSNLAIFLMLH